MTIATLLKRPATKEVVSAPPEPLYPCRSKLMALLAEHEAVTAGIEEFEAKLSRATLDLDHAIDTGTDEQIDRFQSQTSIYNVKLSAKRSVLERLLSSFPSAISSASNEFGTLLMTERDRRIAIIAKRIGEALGTDSDRLISGRYLDDIWDESPAVQAIDRLRLNINLMGATSDLALTTARTLLDHYDAVIKASNNAI